MYHFANGARGERTWMITHCIKESQTNETGISIRGNLFFARGEI